MILRNIVTRAMQPGSENDPFSAAMVGAKDFLVLLGFVPNLTLNLDLNLVYLDLRRFRSRFRCRLSSYLINISTTVRYVNIVGLGLGVAFGVALGCGLSVGSIFWC